MDLWLHKTSGHWCKTIRGKRHHFGKDRDAAIAEWARVKDDLLAGRPKPSKDVWTVADACNYLLTAKKRKVDQGELSPRQYADLLAMAKFSVDHFGRHRSIESLQPDDFGELRTKMTDRWAPGGLTARINNIRQVFTYSYKAGKIDREVRFADQFSPPSSKTLRLDRRRKPAKFFEAEEIHKVLAVASPHVKAFTLLGVNCGLGNTDIAMMTRDDINLDAGWHDMPRGKTGAPRRAKLWPETIEAIREAVVSQPSTGGEWKNLVFLTRIRKPWSDPESSCCSLSQAFTKAAKLAGVYKKNAKTFYALRHVTETIGGDAKDQVALNYIMGHEDGSMASVYRESVSDERLEVVNRVIHDWLYRPCG